MEPLPDQGTRPAPSKWIDPIAVIVWLIPVGYLLFNHASLPDTVPMHFDAKGRPDGFGSKSTHLMVMSGLAVFNIGIYLLVRNVHRLDPKATARLGERTYRNLALAVLLFLSVLHVAISYATTAGAFVIDKLLFVMLGAFFAYLGWVMRDIEPNYFVGIRTPWTLEDPDNWRATHRFGSKWFFWGGLLVVLMALVLPRPAVLFAGIAAILVIAFVPIGYSYRYFAAKKKAG